MEAQIVHSAACAWSGICYRPPAVQTEALPAMAFLELERKYAHAHKVGAVDTLEALGQYRFDAEEIRTFCRPVTGASSTILFTGDNDQVLSACLIIHGSIIDGHYFFCRDVKMDK